jgi:tetratricopeptide (TPR) repeat protein
MKNFILFIVVVSILGVTAFVLYRVYYKGESAGEVFRDIRGTQEDNAEILIRAQDAYGRGDYAEAVKDYERVLKAHESDEPGARLEEREHGDLLLETAKCYKKMWEAGGKTNDALRIKALRTFEKYVQEYPNKRRQNLNHKIAELRNPAPASSSGKEVMDESPPKGLVTDRPAGTGR